MPLSTALPSPSIEFYGSFRYPNMIVNAQVLTPCAVGNVFSRRHGGIGQGPVTVAPIISAGGAGVVGPLFSALGGRPAAVVTTVAVPAAAGWTPDLFQPSYDPDAWNVGALYAPDSVVGIFDFHVACTSALFAGAADVTGFWFVPLIPLQLGFTGTTPGGGSPSGGFGVGLNDDGGGGNEWQFISYDAAGTILQRTPVSAAIIPDVTLWSSFRFTVVGAGAGRPAEVSLEVNRTSIVGVQAVPFDDVTLFRPNTLDATASRFCFCHTLGAMAGDGYNFSLYARYGRFTAGGEEIQGV